LLLALLSDPSARSLGGLGVDISQAAVDTARRNASRLGLGDRAVFALCDYASEPLPFAETARVSVILCNPPYLPATVAAAICADDPAAATDGGKEGLHVYAQVAALCGSALLLARATPGALLVLEVPGNRTERHCAVRACFERLAPQLRYAGYGCDDEAGMQRCLLWRFPSGDTGNVSAAAGDAAALCEAAGARCAPPS
jgi:methylase of polypeptide subunit release factors